MSESLINKLKRSAAEFEHAKHVVTYSIVELRPGFVLLGPSRSAQRWLVGIEVALLTFSAAVFVLEKRLLLGSFIFLFTLFLDWNRRKMSRDWLRIDGRHVTGRWTRLANDPTLEIDYIESHLAIDIHTWEEKVFETGELRMRGAVRIRTSPPMVPNILIAESQARGFRLAPDAQATLYRLREHLQPDD